MAKFKVGDKVRDKYGKHSSGVVTKVTPRDIYVDFGDGTVGTYGESDLVVANSTCPVVANALAWKAKNISLADAWKRAYAQLDNRYGKFYLTLINPEQRGSNVRAFATKEEAMKAYEIWKKGIETTDKIKPEFKDRTTNSAPVAENATDAETAYKVEKGLANKYGAILENALSAVQAMHGKAFFNGYDMDAINALKELTNWCRETKKMTLADFE